MDFSLRGTYVDLRHCGADMDFFLQSVYYVNLIV